jgi:hypothetical protein
LLKSWNIPKPTNPTQMNPTQIKFQYIVEDPFYSTIHNSMIRVDDLGNMYADGKLHFEGLSDGMIDVLFNEWLKYNNLTAEELYL